MSNRAHPLYSLAVLDKYKLNPYPPGYPNDLRTFYSPVDNIHDCMCYLLNAAQHSLVVAMYGFDDQQFADILKGKLSQPDCFVQLTLDSSQAGGIHERELLAQEDYPATSIAIGRSEHGAIQHLKMIVIDGVFTVTGSTNWSTGAETKQDNALVVIADPYVAAEARARADAIHANILAKGNKSEK